MPTSDPKPESLQGDSAASPDQARLDAEKRLTQAQATGGFYVFAETGPSNFFVEPCPWADKMVGGGPMWTSG
ncbi:MAG: hypothetical protein WCX71_03640 [Candidatus Buchananbacteria bacterium]